MLLSAQDRMLLPVVTFRFNPVFLSVTPAAVRCTSHLVMPPPAVLEQSVSLSEPAVLAAADLWH
jgi:hypothetical protein